MKTRRRQNLLASVLVCALALATTVARATADPLPSWNDGATKKSITDFVDKVTKEGSPDFVPAAERIATFDNDGTLWCEKPMPIQLFFALDRVKELAPQHPEWKDKEPFASLLKGDVKPAMAGGEHALLEIVMATHTGMTVGEFEKMVQDWIATAKHPKFKQPFTKMVYQPMVELLAYLRANGFKTFIVSGGGIEFMRPWTEGVYGIPPEQVVGSSGKTKYEMRDGKPVLVKLAEVNFIDDRLRKVFPKGFALDASHRPHVTLVQRFVRTEDLDKVYAAVGKVFASANVTGLKLEAFKYYYMPDKDLGLSGIVVKPTPELLKLEQAVIDAVTPFTVKTGTSAAFVTTPEDPEVLPELITYVSDF